MSQQKVNKRGWVKNAAIIFLSVLLVLTFFSNTIANRYLPEVATQQVTAGTLSVQIRGQGTAVAAESFEVKSATSRKVLSVPVKVGDPVSVGDTLIIFSEAASDELKAAQDALDALTLAYQKALINAASGEYSSERRMVQNALDALNEAKAKRDSNIVTDADMAAALGAVNSIKVTLATCEVALAKAQAELDAFGPPVEGSYGDYSKVTAAKNAWDALKLLHSAELEIFNATVEAERGTTSVAVYREFLAMKYSAYEKSTDEDEKAKYRQALAYFAVQGAENDYNAALAAYNSQTTGGSNMIQYNKLKNAVITAESNLKAANNSLAIAQDAYDTLSAKKAIYDAAIKEVSSAQKSYQEALQNLEKSIALENLDLSQMRAEIDEQNALLESLKDGGEGSTVTSQVNGIVASVSVSAGNTAAADSTLMMVEVPDLGYTMSFSVSTEQSQRVRIGESATVLYNYWGVEKTATLVAVTTNPENPTTSKLLVFKLGGEITSGEQISISVGEKGSNYDAIIPNSAIRSDSNGDFVLAVEAKSSVFGNRFSAVRVDVKILAKDDTHTAVTGGLGMGDYVITHSSKPIESGMRVRLPD